MRHLTGLIVALLVLIQCDPTLGCDRCRRVRTVRLAIGAAPSYVGGQQGLQQVDNGAQQGLISATLGATLVERLVTVLLNRLDRGLPDVGDDSEPEDEADGADAVLDRIDESLTRLEGLVEKRLTKVEADVKNLQTSQESLKGVDDRFREVATQIKALESKPAAAVGTDQLAQISEQLKKLDKLDSINEKLKQHGDQLNKLSKTALFGQGLAQAALLNQGEKKVLKELTEATVMDSGEARSENLPQDREVFDLGPAGTAERFIRFPDASGAMKFGTIPTNKYK